MNGAGEVYAAGWFELPTQFGTHLLPYTGLSHAYIARISFGFLGISDHGTSSLGLYPNPTNDHIRFDLPDNQQNLTYELFDITGRSIRRGTFRTGIPIEVSDQGPGQYLVHIRAEGVSYHGYFTILP